MQKPIIININKLFCLLALPLTVLVSCNKALPDAVPITPATPTGNSISDMVNNDTSFSFLKAAIARSATTLPLGDKSSVFTFFAPNNTAFRSLLAVLGLPPSTASLNAFRPGQLDTILRYHLVPGQAYNAASIRAAFPNTQLPSAFTLQAPFFRMSLFAGKNGNTFFINNLPVIQPDVAVANGVVHVIPFVLLPPDKTLGQLAAADTTLSFLMTAVVRADSGQTSNLSKFSYLLNYPPTNFTLFAPDNNAFRQLLAAMGYPPVQATINALPVQTVRGIVAYHLLGAKAYSVNMPAAQTAVPTLLQVAPTIPPLTVKVENTGSSITVLGNGNGGNPSTVTAGDINAINGIMQKINRVLLPQ
jgi:uncharacterized surface protein with fasciclin (FAS1) repeats